MGRKINYRLKILEKLSEGPKKFNELRKATGSSEATIFRHLKRLEKEGRITYDHSDRTYRIVSAGTNDLAKNMVTDAINKMPVASISIKKFERINKFFIQQFMQILNNSSADIQSLAINFSNIQPSL